MEQKIGSWQGTKHLFCLLITTFGNNSYPVLIKRKKNVVFCYRLYWISPVVTEKKSYEMSIRWTGCNDQKTAYFSDHSEQDFITFYSCCRSRVTGWCCEPYCLEKQNQTKTLKSGFTNNATYVKHPCCIAIEILRVLLFLPYQKKNFKNLTILRSLDWC